MSKPIIAIDVPNVSWRNFFALNDYAGFKHSVVYGLLRDLRQLSITLDSKEFVFCFDHPQLIRKDQYPKYKMGRVSDPADRQKVHEELDLLRLEVLPKLGYKNILYHKGAEADDLMAFIVESKGHWQKVCMVSSDTDLYQLLSGTYITIWNPLIKSTVTEGSMWNRYRIKPKEWALFKAMTGCKTDNIEGIPKIGEVTATKYIRGELEGKKVEAILAGSDIVERNLELVKLPCLAIKVPIIQFKNDTVSCSVWDKIVSELELHTLIGKSPI